MSKFTFSKWLSSSGGPLIVMDESRANLWGGFEGQPSDYEIACQSGNYAEKLIMHNAEILVLGDEPLQTSIAKSENLILILRWKWAEDKADIYEAINEIDLDLISSIESIDIQWGETRLVVFDAADTFNSADCLKFQTHSTANNIITFIYEPTAETSVLIHAVSPL